MLKAERQEQIIARLAGGGTESVSAIAQVLDVSDMTVRRDLEELAERGVVERVYGGARMPAAVRESFSAAGIPLLREYSHTEKRRLRSEEKQRIAQRAIELIEPSDTVFLGAGTTVEHMARFLPDIRLRVITNSLSAFKLLEHREHCELYLVGGLYRQQTGCFVGAMAEDAVSPLGIDKAFIGANGISGGSLFCADMDEGRIQRLVLTKARERYAVSDTSKLGRRDFYAFFGLSDLTALVCDDALSDAQRSEIEEQVRLICA